MEEKGMCALKFVVGPNGGFYELEDKETKGYVVPGSVRIVFQNERLTPTQFDKRGNPQICGIAALVLTWRIRQKVRDGILSSEYTSEVMFVRKVSDKPPTGGYAQVANICPICGKELTDSDTKRLHHAYGFDATVHSACVEEFYRMEMIDEIATTISLAFGSIDFAKENRWAWGRGEGQMWFELIPHTDDSTEPRFFRPWILLHTPKGDIKIEWKVEDIKIIFMSDFTIFDMAIFVNEDVAKNFCGNGIRSIHANNTKKMYEYLSWVHKAIYDKHFAFIDQI